MAAVTLCHKSLDIHDIEVSKVRVLAHSDSVFHFTCRNKFNKNTTVEHNLLYN
jgi:hypothetical protein